MVCEHDEWIRLKQKLEQEGIEFDRLCVKAAIAIMCVVAVAWVAMKVW